MTVNVVKVYKTAFVSFILILCLSGCSKKDGRESDKAGNRNEYGTEVLFPTDFSEPSLNLKKLYYGTGETINRMESDSKGNLYLFSIGGSGENSYVSIRNGKEKREVLEDYLGFICYDEAGDVFYTYNQTKRCIEVRNKDFSTERILIKDFSPFEIKEMLIRGDKLYLLSVNDNPYALDESEFIFEEDDYTDFGERLYEVSIGNGEMKDLEIQGLVSMCGQAEGYIYLYVHRDSAYYLEVFDPVAGKSIHSIKIENVGYVFSMVVIGEKMYYVSSQSNGMWSYNMADQTTAPSVSGVFTMLQCDFDVCGDVLVFLDRTAMAIAAFDTKEGRISTSDGKFRPSNENCDVIIGVASSSYLPFDIEELSLSSGMTIGTYESPIYNSAYFGEELLKKLIAGDVDVDIMVLNISSDYIKKLSKDGVCYALDGSETIAAENAKYFDRIAEYFKTGQGNIWGVPLSTYTDVIAAVPGNMEKCGLTKDIFTDFKSFMEALKKTENTEGIFVWGEYYGFDLMCNYISNVDAPDYNSAGYRYFFENIWKGWKRNDDYGYANNPYMGTAQKTKVVNGQEQFVAAVQNAGMIDTKTMLFHMLSEEELLYNPYVNEDVEVFSLPLLDDSYKNTISITKIAVVNPNGKNRDKAMKLLGVLCEKMHDNGTLGIVYKDYSDYPEKMKTNEKLFKALYDINKDSIVREIGIVDDFLANEVTNYQHGGIDIDTALKSMQRKEDAYRNE